MTAYEMRISDWSSAVCSSDLAIVALNHRAQIIVVADAGHDQFGTGGCRLRTRGLPALVLCNPAVGFIRRAVPDRDLMAGLHQMPGHRVAHDAKPDKCNLRHRFPQNLYERRKG